MVRVLVLTYPLTPLGPAACGGTEQVAWLLLRELARSRRFRFTCIAAPGSRLPGGVRRVSWRELAARAGTPWPRGAPLPPAAWEQFWRGCQAGFQAWWAPRRGQFDLIHNQGAYAVRLPSAAAAVPVLFTLHLARELYAPGLVSAAAGVHWQCVSAAQARGYPGGLPVIANGVDLSRFRPRRRPAPRAAPLLFLGRICPEKGAHAALAIARRAGRDLLLVGAPGPFAAHQRYFARCIAPRLGARARWLPPPPAAVKAALLRHAAAVLIPSRIDETSSLVAMGAAACGVPVLALRRGALPEVVAHGETGWLAGDDIALAEAAARLDAIAPAACRRRAEQCFDARRMARDYAALYARLSA